MPSAAFLTAALAVGAAASAIPPHIGIPKPGTASLKQVRNTQFAGRSGPLALAKAYAKFNASMPADLEQAIARISATANGTTRRSTGSAVTTPVQDDVEYLTPVSIGTPAQVLNLDFDTGSSDLWVFSSETPSSQINGQSIYTPSKSSTSKKVTGATWKIKYGDDSSSSGDVYTDKVTVGGLTVTSQAVELAKTVSSSFTSDSDNDGLLGLAFSSINTVKPTSQLTFFDSALDSLDAALFTADLKHNEAGTYNFGFIDDSLYTGTIAYTSVDNSDGFWSFTSPAYAIGSAAKKSSPITGIADTGTTLLLLPDAVVDAYYAKVSGASYDSSQGGYTFACSATLPSFTYYVGTKAIVIPGEYINFSAIDSTGTTCFGGIQSDSDIGFSIYGDVALKAAFVIFDNTPKLGFASKTL